MSRLAATAIFAGSFCFGAIAGCNLKSIKPDEKVEEVVEYSAEIYQCAAVVSAQVQAAGKQPPMPAILGFCAAVIKAKDLPVPQLRPEPTGML